MQPMDDRRENEHTQHRDAPNLLLCPYPLYAKNSLNTNTCTHNLLANPETDNLPPKISPDSPLLPTVAQLPTKTPSAWSHGLEMRTGITERRTGITARAETRKARLRTSPPARTGFNQDSKTRGNLLPKGARRLEAPENREGTYERVPLPSNGETEPSPND